MGPHMARTATVSSSRLDELVFAFDLVEGETLRVTVPRDALPDFDQSLIDVLEAWREIEAFGSEDD